MFVLVDDQTVSVAGEVHACSWQESHRSFCSPAFVEKHTPQRQTEYLQKKMASGTKLFLLTDSIPVGIVSVTGSLIEDLYVLPGYHRKGYGTSLLRFAMAQCDGNPTLWILENNGPAEALYRKNGFLPTGNRHFITDGLDEIEFAKQRF